MKLIDVNKINWKKLFTGCTFPLNFINEDYDITIKSEDYTWEVLLKDKNTNILL